MFRLTKVKVAGLIAAGAVTLGAVGAYAANSGSMNLTTGFSGVTVGTGSKQIKLVGLNGTTTVPASTISSWTNPGECVSYFAKTRDYALQPSNFTSAQTSLKLSKNYHGKLMAALGSWCQQFNTKSTGDTSDGSAVESDGGSGFQPTHAHGRP